MKKTLIMLMALGLMAASSMATISYVTGGTTGVNNIDTGAQTLTLAGFGAGSGNYVVVAVGAKTQNDASDIVTGVTYGGASLTRIGFIDVEQSGWYTRSYLYAGLVSSASGDVVMSYNATIASTDFDGVDIGVTSWSGVSGIGTATAGSTTLNGSAGGTISDSITTIFNNSVIVTAVTLADGRGTESAVLDSILRTTTTTDMVGSYLVSTDAATAGLYTPGLTWSGRNTRRQTAISAELFEAVPEPATVGMLGLGALVALLARRIRA